MRLIVSIIIKSSLTKAVGARLSWLTLCFVAFASIAQTQAQVAGNTGASTTPTVDATSASNLTPSATSTANKSAAPTAQTSGNLSWKNLSAEQHTALARLAAEWDSMDDLRKKRWLGVASKYANMKPEEQLRVQERIQAWMKMTPEQRMAVRQNFSNTSKKTAEQKSAQWQSYQQLSEEEKKKLAQDAKIKKTITTIQPESKRTAPVLAPIKKGPPPAPVVSKAASQASVNP